MDKLLWQCRIMPHTTTDHSPCELLMGRRLRPRLDLIKPNLHRTVSKRQSMMKQRYDMKMKDRVVEADDRVYVKLWQRDKTWIRGVTGSTRRSVVGAELEEVRMLRSHLHK
ncbi:unnamed protein product, partial [Dicrocoelium dendriticum]